VNKAVGLKLNSLATRRFSKVPVANGRYSGYEASKTSHIRLSGLNVIRAT
jgi:hypothetical protein